METLVSPAPIGTARSPKRVPVRYFSLLLGFLRAQGVNTARLLELTGIDPGRFERPDGMLLLSEAEAFVNASYRLSGRKDLGFEAGRLIKPNSHDLLGYGMLSCRDLDQMLRLASRHYHLITELFTMRYRRGAQRGEVVFSPTTAMSLEMLRFHMEAIAVSTCHHIQLLSGPGLASCEIRLGMPVPRHHARYVAMSSADFRFDDRALPGVTMVIDASALDKALPLAAPQVVEQIEERLQALRRRPGPDARWGDYVAMLLREAKGQQVTLDEIARRMNISERTIDRHLKKEQLQFRDLSQQVRFERARELLVQRGTTVSRVAEQLGFTDAANFTRAFRRHSGETPSEFQRAASACGASC